MTKLATRRRPTINSAVASLLDTFSQDYPTNLRFISDLWDIPNYPSTNYPPYNIMYGENSGDYTIEVALAGFGRDDLEVEFVKDQKLTIRSKTQESDSAKGGDEKITKYVKRGIGKRSFNLSFSIPQHSAVESCEMRDGLLIIEIRREIPEEEKPKLLDIK